MFCIVSHFLYFVLHVFCIFFGGGHVFAFFVFFMFFFRFVFRVWCERPCEQLSIPKLRFVLCFFSDLFSVCVANVPASNFIYQNCDVFYVFFQILFPCVLRASLRATLYTKTAICSAPLATKKCRYSGVFRATSSTKTAIVRCLASVPVGPCLVLFSLCARAHFFCFHPKIAVPCTIPC